MTNEPLQSNPRSYCNANAHCVNQDGWTSSTTYVCACNNGYENWRANQGKTTS